MTKAQLKELNDLVKATGLTQAEVARRLDVKPETLNRWLKDQDPSHPAMLLGALRLMVLEQKGIITLKLIEVALR